MSYLATVYRVMLASPSDIKEERNIIRELISKWNDINSSRTKIVLLPIGWETHLAPETGDKPQAIIDKRILKDCDLLVGVLWTRVGTPTEKYDSGTIEEIEEHINSGKPAMVYFSNAEVKLEKVDIDQYEKVKQYKKSCKDRSIYREYNDLDDFKNQFDKHLQLKINEHEYFVQATNLDDDSLENSKQSTELVLTEEAKILLLEAAEDRNGYILHLKYLGGETIQTNGKSFIETDSPREIAKWESVLEELERYDLIRAEGYKGESYKITSLGYKVADIIKTEQA
jgi:hypothetical protein